MFKKIALLTSFCAVLSLTPSYAGGDWTKFDIREDMNGKRTVKATWKDDQGKVKMRSASTKDCYDYVKNLTDRENKVGYSTPEGSFKRFDAQNLDRQNKGNLFHLLRVSYNGEDIGFVQFGRMNTINYPEGCTEEGTEHHAIIQKFIDLGITQKEDEAQGYGKENILRIESRGLGFILPLFSDVVEIGPRAVALEAFYQFVCKETKRGGVLPVEGTVAHAVIGLHHPEDVNLKAFAEAGFKIDTNEGFGWFYPKKGVPDPRHMVVRFINEEM